MKGTADQISEYATGGAAGETMESAPARPKIAPHIAYKGGRQLTDNPVIVPCPATDLIQDQQSITGWSCGACHRPVTPDPDGRPAQPATGEPGYLE